MDERERETMRQLTVAAVDFRNMLVDGVNYADPCLLIAPGQSDHVWLSRLDAALQAAAAALGCDLDLTPFTIWNHEP